MFPELDAEEVLVRTRLRWDLSGPLPVPVDGWLACPVCRFEQVQVRFWRFHVRSDIGHTVPHRCDVSFKCTGCAAVWIHGVVLDEHTHTRMARARKRPNSQILWREGKKMLEGA